MSAGTYMHQCKYGSMCEWEAALHVLWKAHPKLDILDIMAQVQVKGFVPTWLSPRATFSVGLCQDIAAYFNLNKRSQLACDQLLCSLQQP